MKSQGLLLNILLKLKKPLFLLGMISFLVFSLLPCHSALAKIVPPAQSQLAQSTLVVSRNISYSAHTCHAQKKILTSQHNSSILNSNQIKNQDQHRFSPQLVSNIPRNNLNIVKPRNGPLSRQNALFSYQISQILTIVKIE